MASTCWRHPTSTRSSSCARSCPRTRSRSDLSSPSADLAIAEVHRAQWGRLLSVLVRRTRRLDLAEDALAQAFANASERWPRDGVPANPPGWLYTAAYRTIVGRLRAEAVAGRRAPLLAVRHDAAIDDTLDDRDELPDDRLQLILLCCHPALDPAARSAMSLRLVMGTPTDEIARLFLVQPATMAARLTRAKRKIAAAGIPLARPVGDELSARLDAVVRTVYLAFTAGYAPGTGPDLLRAESAGEAVRLAALVHRLTDAPQATALLALVSFQHARRDARVRDGRLVTLANQDRSSWHHDEIAAACGLLDAVPPVDGYAEQLRLEASIAREHSIAPSTQRTDWPRICDHYAALEALTGSPIVRLNRAIAVAEVEGPDAGLRMLDAIAPALASSHRLHAVGADLARRAGRFDAARDAYRRAIALCANDTERSFLASELDRLDRRQDPSART